MPIWKLLHILSMFSAVTLLFGGDILFHALRRTGDVVALRRFVRVVNPIFVAGVWFLALGVATGLATAATGGWSVTERWLIAAYVFVIAIFIVGFAIGLPYYRKVARAIESGTDELTPRVREALADLRGIGSLVASFVLYVAVISVMVFKPFA